MFACYFLTYRRTTVLLGFPPLTISLDPDMTISLLLHDFWTLENVYVRLCLLWGFLPLSLAPIFYVLLEDTEYTFVYLCSVAQDLAMKSGQQSGLNTYQLMWWWRNRSGEHESPETISSHLYILWMWKPKPDWRQMSFEPLLYFFAFVIVPIKNKERENKSEERRKKKKKNGKEGVGRR